MLSILTTGTAGSKGALLLSILTTGTDDPQLDRVPHQSHISATDRSMPIRALATTMRSTCNILTPHKENTPQAHDLQVCKSNFTITLECN